MDSLKNLFKRKPIEIAFDKLKLTKAIAINSFFFIPLFSLYFYTKFQVSLFFFPCLLVLGSNIYFYINKWVRGKPAYIINSKGIWDNSSVLSIGWIEWGKIEEIRIHEVNYETITLVLKNPQSIMNTISNPLKKSLMWINWKFGKSPILFYSKITEIEQSSLLHEMKMQFRQNKDASIIDLSEHLIDEN